MLLWEQGLSTLQTSADKVTLSSTVATDKHESKPVLIVNALSIFATHRCAVHCASKNQPWSFSKKYPGLAL
jgi:hypothetical protein